MNADTISTDSKMTLTNIILTDGHVQTPVPRYPIGTSDTHIIRYSGSKHIHVRYYRPVTTLSDSYVMSFA